MYAYTHAWCVSVRTWSVFLFCFEGLVPAGCAKVFCQAFGACTFFVIGSVRGWIIPE